MSEITAEAEIESDKNHVADLNQRMTKGTKNVNKASFRRYMTPFVTACIAFFSLAAFNVIWAMIFGNPLGGQPIAILEINWVRPEKTQTFIPDFDANTGINGTQFMPNGYKLPTDQSANNGAEMPRITASGNSKIIHLSSKMAESVPESFATNGKLPRAPIEDVVQLSRFGKLPKIGVLGKKPSDVYARPAPIFDGRPRIAIMITGLGIHHDATKTAIDDLPGQITFGFSPYGEGLQDWINRARDKGHEIILQTPMEPFDYPDNDPGPSTLLADGGTEVNLNRLKWVLSRITGYIGITNFMGAKFTSKEKAIAPILDELQKRGLYYVENGVLHRSKVSEISKRMNLGYSKVDVIIDEKKTIENIENSLERIEKIATTTGMAFAIGSNIPATIKHVKAWANTLEAKGYQLVPVSVKIKDDLKASLATETMPTAN